MSNNPYSPSEYVPRKTTRRLLIRRDFLFWSIDPLTWATVPLLNCLIFVLRSPTSNVPADTVIIIAIINAFLAFVYGTLYSFVLSIICRMLKVLPRAQLHFWTVFATTVLMIFSEQSILLTLCVVTLVGGCVAVAARKMAAA